MEKESWHQSQVSISTNTCTHAPTHMKNLYAYSCTHTQIKRQRERRNEIEKCLPESYNSQHHGIGERADIDQ